MSYRIAFEDFPVLETERLILRKISFEKDGEFLFDEIYSDPEVVLYDKGHIISRNNFISKSFGIPTVENKIDLWEKMYKNQRVIVWGLELKSTGELIGFRYCQFFSHMSVYTESKVAKRFWRKGYMYEATNAIFCYLKGVDIVQFFSIINNNNFPAIQLVKKLGFKDSDKNDFFIGDLLDDFDTIQFQGLRNTYSKNDEKLFVYPYFPKKALIDYEKGVNFLLKENFIDAIILLESSLKNDENFVLAKIKFGFAAIGIQLFQPSISILNEINNNQYASLFFAKAIAYSNLDDFISAERELLEYLKIVSNSKNAKQLLIATQKLISVKKLR